MITVELNHVVFSAHHALFIVFPEGDDTCFLSVVCQTS